ncbi:hypothetical protein LCM23_06390 [Cytobacillus kochii]|uniref:hypothetical protein n=1 Tax=Cytobacillus kochii TaxID=859143 RepID=UPI001CD757A5|nr:hypothetical protein [Cytobacillus kochii]MCA1025714.1 hypothetical protein [Cytobacillus kochii]
MSFTITCDQCGEMQVFKEGDRWFQNNIELDVVGDGEGDEIINIFCGNLDCPNQIDVMK